MSVVAQPGDLVLLLTQDENRYLVRLQPGTVWHSNLGRIPHDQLIGQAFGQTVQTLTGRAILMLEPSTHDLISLLKRVSQIIFPKDVAYILLRLNLFPGRVVLEAGSGSGGLTLALARAVMPGGHVYSYEIRPEAHTVTRRNLDGLGLLPYVTLYEQDAAAGFHETGVDACFLDLRAPWDILPQAAAALKLGGFFGCLVPTTNQVEMLLRGLDEHGFSDVSVEELLLRPYKPIPGRLRPADRMVAHTGYLLFARKLAPGEAERWRPRERKRHAGRVAMGEGVGSRE
jgi:tRNA (adenine57-N1/adenine58-N1)-methyltransferase